MCEPRAARQAGTEPGRFWEAARGKEGTRAQESEKLHQGLRGLHSHGSSPGLSPCRAVGFEPTPQGRGDDRTVCSGGAPDPGRAQPRAGLSPRSSWVSREWLASDGCVRLLSRLTTSWNREQALHGLTISLKNKEN